MIDNDIEHQKLIVTWMPVVSCIATNDSVKFALTIPQLRDFKIQTVNKKEYLFFHRAWKRDQIIYFKNN